MRKREKHTEIIYIGFDAGIICWCRHWRRRAAYLVSMRQGLVGYVVDASDHLQAYWITLLTRVNQVNLWAAPAWAQNAAETVHNLIIHWCLQQITAVCMHRCLITLSG